MDEPKQDGLDALAKALGTKREDYLARPDSSPIKDTGDKIASVKAGAAKYKMNPVDYLTAMLYETGGTLSPVEPGPVTQWGQHKGTIQYGETQWKEYGVKPDFHDQVTRTNLEYLKRNGVREGATFAEIYKAINAGDPNADDNTPEFMIKNGKRVPTGRTTGDNVRLANERWRKKAEQMLGMSSSEPLEVSLDDYMKKVGSQKEVSLDDYLKPAEDVKQGRLEPTFKKPVLQTTDHTKTDREFSSTQVDLPDNYKKEVLDIGKKIIRDDDVHEEEGREENPHITVKFGLHDNDPGAVGNLLAGQKPFAVKLGKTKVFDTNPDYDVVYVEAESPELHELNKKISIGTKNTDTHPEYKPHMTLAYVKKGEGQKYVDRTDLEGKEVMFSGVTFSGKDHIKSYLPFDISGDVTQLEDLGEKIAGDEAPVQSGDTATGVTALPDEEEATPTPAAPALGTAKVDPKWTDEEKVRAAAKEILEPQGVTPIEVEDWITAAKATGDPDALVRGDRGLDTFSIFPDMLEQIKEARIKKELSGRDFAAEEMERAIAPPTDEQLRSEAIRLLESERTRRSMTYAGRGDMPQEPIDPGPITDLEIQQKINELKNDIPSREDAVLAYQEAQKYNEQGAWGTIQAGLSGGASRILNTIGVATPIIPTKARAALRSRAAGMRMAEQLQGDGSIGNQALKIASGAVPDLMTLTVLPGGPVGKFAFLGGAQSVGRGENISNIAKHTVQGGILGGTFKASAGAGEIVKKAFPRLENPVRIGAVFGTSVPINAAFGMNDDENLHATVVNTLFEIGGIYGPKMLGRTYRMWRKGEAKDVHVDEKGEATLGDADPANKIDGEIVLDPQEPVYDASPTHVDKKGKKVALRVQPGKGIELIKEDGTSEILNQQEFISRGIKPIKADKPVPETQEAIDAQTKAAADPEVVSRIGVLHTEKATVPKAEPTFFRLKLKNGDTLDVDKAGWIRKANSLGVKPTKTELVKYTGLDKDSAGTQDILGRVEAVADTSQGIAVEVTNAQTDKQVDAAVVTTPENAKKQIENYAEQYQYSDFKPGIRVGYGNQKGTVREIGERGEVVIDMDDGSVMSLGKGVVAGSLDIIEPVKIEVKTVEEAIANRQTDLSSESLKAKDVKVGDPVVIDGETHVVIDVSKNYVRVRNSAAKNQTIASYTKAQFDAANATKGADPRVEAKPVETDRRMAMDVTPEVAKELATPRETKIVELDNGQKKTVQQESDAALAEYKQSVERSTTDKPSVIPLGMPELEAKMQVALDKIDVGSDITFEQNGKQVRGKVTQITDDGRGVRGNTYKVNGELGKGSFDKQILTVKPAIDKPSVKSGKNRKLAQELAKKSVPTTADAVHDDVPIEKKPKGKPKGEVFLKDDSDLPVEVGDTVYFRNGTETTVREMNADGSVTVMDADGNIIRDVNTGNMYRDNPVDGERGAITLDLLTSPLQVAKRVGKVFKERSETDNSWTTSYREALGLGTPKDLAEFREKNERRAQEQRDRQYEKGSSLFDDENIHATEQGMIDRSVQEYRSRAMGILEPKGEDYYTTQTPFFDVDQLFGRHNITEVTDGIYDITPFVVPFMKLPKAQRSTLTKEQHDQLESTYYEWSRDLQQQLNDHRAYQKWLNKGYEPTISLDKKLTGYEPSAIETQMARQLTGQEGAVSLDLLTWPVRKVMEEANLLHAAIKEATISPRSHLRSAGISDEATRHAYARAAVPYMTDNLLSQTFSDIDPGTGKYHYQTPDMMRPTMDILNKDNILGGYDQYVNNVRIALEAGDAELAAKWQAKVDAVDAAHDIDAMDAEVRESLNDPQIVENARRWRENVNPLLDAMYHRVKGVDQGTYREGRGRHHGARVNLLEAERAAKLEQAYSEMSTEALPETSSNNYRNPDVRRDANDRAATFTHEYTDDPRAILLNVLGRRYNEFTKLNLYDGLVREGRGAYKLNIRAMGEDAQAQIDMLNAIGPVTYDSRGIPQTLHGEKAVPFQAKMPQTGNDGHTTHVEKTMWVAGDKLHTSLRQVVDTDMKTKPNYFGQRLTNIQLAQVIDAAAHMKNIHTIIAYSPVTRSTFYNAARKLPVLGTVDTIARLVKKWRDLEADTPEIRRQIAEMAQNGMMRSDFHGHGNSPLSVLGKVIKHGDKAARVIGSEVFDIMVENNLVENTMTNRRQFVQQMGEYNGRLLSQAMNVARRSGFAPFVVAGTTFNRMGMKQLTGSPGVPALNKKAAARMRIENISGIPIKLATVAMLNLAFTGMLGGRPGTPIGSVDFGMDEDERGKHLTWDMLSLGGERRGMRLTGLNALANGLKEGQSAGEIGLNAFNDAAGTLSHPWIGPAPGFLIEGATGRQFDLRAAPAHSEARNMGDGLAQIGENYRAALKDLNPFLYGIGTAVPLVNRYIEPIGEDTEKNALTRVIEGVGAPVLMALGRREVKSPASKLMTQIQQAQATYTATPERVTAREHARTILKEAKEQGLTPEIEEKIKNAVQNGTIDIAQVSRLRENATYKPIAVRLKYMNSNVPDLIRVWERMTPEEQQDSRQVMLAKLGRLAMDGKLSDIDAANLTTFGITPESLLPSASAAQEKAVKEAEKFNRTQELRKGNPLALDGLSRKDALSLKKEVTFNEDQEAYDGAQNPVKTLIFENTTDATKKAEYAAILRHSFRQLSQKKNKTEAEVQTVQKMNALLNAWQAEKQTLDDNERQRLNQIESGADAVLVKRKMSLKLSLPGLRIPRLN